MKRSLLIFSALATTAFAQAAPPAPTAPAALPSATPAAKPKAAPAPAPKLEWHDVTTWGVEGRAWPELPRERWFDRLPAEAQAKVTPAVWGLSRDSAGMVARFKTDSATVWAKYKLRKPVLAMPHMPATGVSGVDLYARDESGRWRWVNVTRPAAADVQQEIQGGLAPGLREYAAYLPLFNGIESLSIGVAAGAKFEGLAPREKPIVFYGTSITHGACASRPGIVHSGILGRQLDRPVVNLGFSGNGRMDAAVGEYLAKIDAAVYVIDCLPNMDANAVRTKGPPLIKALRAAKPNTPIVLVEDRVFTNTWIRPERQKFHKDNHAALREVFEGLQKENIGRLFYIPGDHLLGDDTEGATDASHPNDLGFMRQAEIFAPVLRQALEAK